METKFPKRFFSRKTQRKSGIILWSNSQKCAGNININDRSILCYNYFLTYLLTLWSRVLLEKLTVIQLVTKYPAFYGARRFITAFTSSRHLSLS